MARLLVSFTGRATPGVISVSGVKAGDRVLGILFTNDAYEPAPGFASFVISDNELTYYGGEDYHTYTFTALLDRDVVIP